MLRHIRHNIFKLKKGNDERAPADPEIVLECDFIWFEHFILKMLKSMFTDITENNNYMCTLN